MQTLRGSRSIEICSLSCFRCINLSTLFLWKLPLFFSFFSFFELPFYISISTSVQCQLVLILNNLGTSNSQIPPILWNSVCLSHTVQSFMVAFFSGMLHSTFFCSSIVVNYTWHQIYHLHHFKGHNEVALNSCTVLCSHQHYPFLELSHHHNLKLCTHQISPHSSFLFQPLATTMLLHVSINLAILEA